MAAVIGGVGAGMRLDDAALSETERGLDGSVVFVPPRAPATGAREVALTPTSERPGPFQLSAVEAAIADVAVAVVQLRGEPTRFDRVLAEVLLGLDHLGHLRRLVGTPRPVEEADGEPATPSQAGFFGLVSDLPTATGPTAPDEAGAPAGLASAGGAPREEGIPASDPVRLTLEIIRRELRRPDHPRLVELEEDLWWLRDPLDLAGTKASLSERLEWGIFSLLSTSGGISQASFDERVGRLFRGPETADPELVRACLESLPHPRAVLGRARPHRGVPAAALRRARRDGGSAHGVRASAGHAGLGHQA